MSPKDSGRLMRLDEYLGCLDRPGFISEIIDGVVQVSPGPGVIHCLWRDLIARRLMDFAKQRPEVINFVGTNNDVDVPYRPGPTRPRPDLTGYRGFPKLSEIQEDVDWAQLCPVVVVEIISRRRPKKDTVRNRQLYWSNGGIGEYWIVDPRKAPKEPLLIALAREAGRSDWSEHVVPFGQTWPSVHLPGFALNLKDLADSAG